MVIVLGANFIRGPELELAVCTRPPLCLHRLLHDHGDDDLVLSNLSLLAPTAGRTLVLRLSLLCHQLLMHGGADAAKINPRLLFGFPTLASSSVHLPDGIRISNILSTSPLCLPCFAAFQSIVELQAYRQCRRGKWPHVQSRCCPRSYGTVLVESGEYVDTTVVSRYLLPPLRLASPRHIGWAWSDAWAVVVESCRSARCNTFVPSSELAPQIGLLEERLLSATQRSVGRRPGCASDCSRTIGEP